MKKILAFVLVSASLLSAKIVDRVVASVNSEPITSYDITKTFQKMNMTPQEALNYLIDRKILENEINKRGISVDDFDVENALEKIAQKNGMTLFEFKSYLQQRGELDKIKQQIKENLLKEKLFSQIVNSKLRISEEEIKNYYQNHKNEFTTFKTIQVTAYYSKSPQKLQEIQKNPFISDSNIVVKTHVYEYNEIPVNLMYLFKNTKEGEFTPIINNGTSYVTFYIARKDGKVLLPLENVKSLIANKLIKEKRDRILKEYFAKVKNQADIKIYNN